MKINKEIVDSGKLEQKHQKTENLKIKFQKLNCFQKFENQAEWQRYWKRIRSLIIILLSEILSIRLIFIIQNLNGNISDKQL